MHSEIHATWQDRVLRRPVCDLLGCRLPLVLAGMSGAARAELAVAVSRAGGFGFLDMAREPVTRIREEVAQMRAAGVTRFGVNLIPCATDAALLDQQLDACIELKVPVLGLYRGVMPDLIRHATDAGLLVVQQVDSLADARQAEAAGAGVLVVQGVEAGGHVRAGQPLFELLPEVLAAVHVPVLAAGGVSDGADVATALALGAQGAMLGTAHHHKRGLVEAGSSQAVLTEGAGERLLRIAERAAQMLRTAASEPPVIEMSSPVCYAREFELVRDDAIDRPSLLAALGELLEGARAGMRSSLPGSTVMDAAADPQLQSRLAALHRDEVKWCGMLIAATLALGAAPSTRTSAFFEEAAAIADPGERASALLRRRQGQALQLLRTLVPRVVDERLSDGLAEMLAAYRDV